MTTRATNEPGLRRAIASVDIAAGGASLRSMPRVNANYSASESLGLVFQEAFELCERPGVQPPFGFSPRCFYPRPNVRQVFNNDGGSRRNASQNALAQYVIAIPPEARFAPREAAQVLFRTLAAIGLQFPFEAETPFADFTPALLAVKPAVRGDGRAADAEIDSESLSIIHEFHIVKLQNDVESEPAFSVHQVSGGNLATKHFTSIGRNDEGYLLPPANSGKVRQTTLPIHRERILVVARRAERGSGRAYFPPFPGKRDSRLNSLGRFLPRLNVQIRDQYGTKGFTIAIREVVQSVGVALFEPPTLGADKIERLRKLTHSFQQALRLRRCGFKRQPQRSVHASIIPYRYAILQ